MKRRSFSGVVVIAVLALVALAPTAAAEQPVTTITTIDRTFTLPAGPGFCPFPFVVHSQGTLRDTVYANGKDGHLTAPGQGTIFADVGKLVYIADPHDVNTPLSIVKSTGHQEPNQFPATCEGLS